MSSLGFPEILLILGIAFLVFVIFGPKNLPKLGKMFGSTMKEVRKGMNEFSEEMNEAGGTPVDGGTPIYSQEVDAVPVTHVAPVVAETPLVEPGRKVARVIYEDELAPQPEPDPAVAIDPDRKVAKVVYEDEV
jgi:sec-independent protein translocase protein TatA